jgi:hypothetical protein
MPPLLPLSHLLQPLLLLLPALQLPCSLHPPPRCPSPHPTHIVQWGTPGAFPQLSVLSLDSNRINGSLPRIWGSPRAMSLLQEL